MTQKKSASDFVVNDEFESIDFQVTEEFNENYLHAVEDFHPRYIEPTSDGPPIVHSALLINYSNITRSPSYYLPADTSALHTHDEVEYINPGRVGSTFSVTWKVIETYEKRGRPFQVIDTLMVDDSGNPILRRKSINTYISGPTADR